MVHLTFYWDAWAIFDDDDVFRMIQREDYEGATWKECCDECVKSWDWVAPDKDDLPQSFQAFSYKRR